MAFIGDNFTRYSTEDLEALVEQAYQAVKVHKPSFFGAGGVSTDTLVFRIVGDQLPVRLSYWRGSPHDLELSEPRRLRSGRNTPPYYIEVPGPWYTRPMMASTAGYHGRAWASSKSLHVLSPNGMDNMLTPMEALAATGIEVPLMPQAAEAQILYHILSKAGVRVSNIPPRTMDGDHSKLLQFMSE